MTFPKSFSSCLVTAAGQTPAALPTAEHGHVKQISTSQVSESLCSQREFCAFVFSCSSRARSGTDTGHRASVGCTNNGSPPREAFPLREIAPLILEHRTACQGKGEEPRHVGNLKLVQTELWRHPQRAVPRGPVPFNHDDDLIVVRTQTPNPSCRACSRAAVTAASRWRVWKNSTGLLNG